MNSAMQYIMESVAATGIFYLIFILFLKNKAFLVFNRIIILVMIGLGIILPVIHIPLPQEPQTFANAPVASVYMEELAFTIMVNEVKPAFSWLKMLYAIISSGFFILLLVQVYKIYGIYTHAQIQIKGKIQVLLMDNAHIHFSFFNYVFINARLLKNEEEQMQVMQHEMVHAEQQHTWDILFIEIIKILFWINPFLWLFKKQMVENHEYLADRGAIKTSGKNHPYLRYLVDNALFGSHFSLVNNFNYSLIKKRIHMLTKRRISWLEIMVVVLVVPLFIVSFLFFACSEEHFENPLSRAPGDVIQVKKSNKFLDPNGIKFTSDGEKIYQFIEDMPEFEGQDYNAFRNYIKDNLNYPPEAKSRGLEGKALIRFNIGSEGKVKDVTLIQGTYEVLNEEALRVIRSSPDWKPGEVNGRKVAVQFTFTVTFGQEKSGVPKIVSGNLDNTRSKGFTYHSNQKVIGDTLIAKILKFIPENDELHGISGEVSLSFDFDAGNLEIANLIVDHSTHPKLPEVAINYIKTLADFGTFYKLWKGNKAKPKHFKMYYEFTDDHKDIYRK